MKIRRTFVISTFIFLVIIFLLNNTASSETKVYDNNNQYLGLLLDLRNTYLTVFIPSLGASWHIAYDTPNKCTYGVMFESTDCTGQPYAFSRGPLPEIHDFTNHSLGGYYVPDHSAKKTITDRSYINEACTCRNGTNEPSEAIPLVEVEMPFAIPIELPIRFEQTVNTVTTSDFFVIPVRKK